MAKFNFSFTWSFRNHSNMLIWCWTFFSWLEKVVLWNVSWKLWHISSWIEQLYLTEIFCKISKVVCHLFVIILSLLNKNINNGNNENVMFEG